MLSCPFYVVTPTSDHTPLDSPSGPMRVTFRKNRVRESRLPGAVKGRAEWPSYSTRTRFGLDGKNDLWLRESGEMFFMLSAALRGDVQLGPYKFQIWP